MYVMLSVHKPHAQHESALIDSMHRFGSAAKTQPGLIRIHAMKDARSGRLIGLAIWESRESAIAAMPAMQDAVKDDDFETWEAEDGDMFQLTEV